MTRLGFRVSTFLFLAAVATTSAWPQGAESPTLVASGDVAPDFSLESIDGDHAKLSAAVSDGPVVLVFFRGVW